MADHVPALGLEPADVAEMPLEQLAALLVALGALQGAVLARLASAAVPGRNGDSAPATDEMLTAEKAARRTGMSKRWLYKNRRTLPFARTMGRSVRFSTRGIDRWLNTRKA